MNGLSPQTPVSFTWKPEAFSDYLVLCGLNKMSLKSPASVAKIFIE